MSHRLIPLLVLAAALLCTGATVVAVSGRGASNPVDTVALQAPVLLPTIVVRPEPQIPVLGEITVSPSRTERAAAGLEVADDKDALGAVAERVRTSSRALLPGTGFGMPYYSFGKPVQRASKE